MSNRRTFLQSLSLGAGGALTTTLVPPQVGKRDRIQIEDFEIFTLEFPTVTPVSWNAIKKSGGKRTRVSFLEIRTDAGIKGYTMTKGSHSDIAHFVKKTTGHQSATDRKDVAPHVLPRSQTSCQGERIARDRIGGSGGMGYRR